MEPNWRTGEGYPTIKTDIRIWAGEFFRRAEGELTNIPHFKLPDGTVEVFLYPVIHQFNYDGSLVIERDNARNNSTRMIIEFAMDEDISLQIIRAERWLKGNQTSRYLQSKERLRADRFVNYLRLLDAERANVPREVIATLLYPHLPIDYPECAGQKHVSKCLKAAKRLTKKFPNLKLKKV
jgi:hypothetical protein